MLQYPLPPLSLSSSRKKDRSGIRSNDSSSRTPPVPPLPSKLNLRRPTHVPSSIPSASNPHTSPLSPINVSSYSPSSPASPTYTSSPVPLPGPSASHPWTTTNLPSENASSTRRSSMASSLIGDVLSPGDVVGEGIQLQGEDTRLVSVHPTDESEAPAQEFEVIRRLGTGSYAVVYLVREVLSRPAPSTDGHISIEGMELDDKITSRPTIEYGRDFAIKCLSKVDIDGEEALVAQKAEVTIHQSLRSHPNIATLHRTFETSSFLLLLLEFVPGEDLFYFLEKARDHYEPESPTSEQAISSSRTPPTPSLLSNLHPSLLLSRNRLRLIASMFSQMCDAVAACHDQQVFHRDIKPENFIVMDGWSTLPNGSRERKVIVKLTDFGLSTTDPESSDMDCGSAPYMSYECRNNVDPTYKPRAADVWSLGIVLINMLYHCNPWQDTAYGTCNSFDLYRKQPVAFFMQRFNGMTRSVAEYLATKVFCILDDPKDDSQRVEARDFGTWIKDLPAHLGDTNISGHKRVISTSSTQGFPIAASVPPSRRPSSRQTDINTHVHAAGLRSRAPSLGPAFGVERSTLFDQDLDRDEEGMYSRSTSTNKRRKRGARKGKGSGVPTPQPHLPGSAIDDTLETLATASQSLAREISKASRSSSKRRGDLPLDSTDMPPVPVIQAPPVVTKKASKWKLGFGKNTSSGEKPLASPVDEVPPSDINRSTAMSATANNVTNLIMGLSATTPSSSGISRSKTPDADQASSWARGRRPKSPVPPVPTGPRRSSPPLMWAHSAYSGHLAPQPFKRDQRANSPRTLSPSSTRSGRPVASSASSMTSSNWRNSTSSAMTSSSAFTSYSNSSSRSVSTQATSVSASSWRTQGTNQSKPRKSHSPVSMYSDPAQQQMPKNVKFLTGVPWELNELPRQMHMNPVGDIFGSPPPPRKQRVRNKPKDQLDTIVERSGMSPKTPVPVSESQEAMESHLDLEEVVVEDEDGVPKKVQKGQINALAKMLSALRR